MGFLKNYCYIALIVLVQPLYVAEVLTMRQLVVLRIHTNSCLERTCIYWLYLSLKGKVVTLMTLHLEWINSINLLAILYLIFQNYKLKTYSVVQALLVDDILNLVLLTSLNTIDQSIIL